LWNDNALCNCHFAWICDNPGLAVFDFVNIFADIGRLGSEYYTQFNRDKKIKSHLKQLERLGWNPEGPDSTAQKCMLHAVQIKALSQIIKTW